MQGWAAHMYFFFITNMLFQGTTETVHKYVMTVCEALAPVKDMRCVQRTALESRQVAGSRVHRCSALADHAN